MVKLLLLGGRMFFRCVCSSHTSSSKERGRCLYRGKFCTAMGDRDRNRSERGGDRSDRGDRNDRGDRGRDRSESRGRKGGDRDRDRDSGRDRDRGRDRDSGRDSGRDNGRDRRDGGRDRDGGRGRDRSRDRGETTSLLVRNLAFSVKASELNHLFSRYGDIKDVYLPLVRNALSRQTRFCG